MIRYALILACVTVVGATALKQPGWLLQYGSGTFLFGFLFIVLAFSSWGSITLGPRSLRMPFLQYCALLVLAQIALMMVSVTAGLAFISVGPKLTESAFVLREAKAIISQYYLSKWGIFPWGLYGLWALVIGYTHYIKGEYPLIATEASKIFSPQFEPVVKGAVEYIVSMSTLLCLCFSIGGAIVLLSFFIEFHLKWPLHVKTALLTLMILSCCSSILFQALRSKAFLKITHTLSLSSLPWIMLAILLPLFVVSAYLGQWCLQHLPLQMAKIQGNCFYPVQKVPATTQIASLFWGWCLLWLPLAGSFIARVSKGRTVREMVVGVVLLPLIGGGFMATLSFEMPFIPIYSPVCMGLSITTLVLISYMMRGARNNIFFYAGWMPMPSGFKTSRVDIHLAPKLRGMQKCFIMLGMSLLSVCLTHTLGGWFLISVQCVALGTFMMSLTYIGLILGLYRVLTYKRELKTSGLHPLCD